MASFGFFDKSLSDSLTPLLTGLRQNQIATGNAAKNATKNSGESPLTEGVELLNSCVNNIQKIIDNDNQPSSMPSP